MKRILITGGSGSIGLHVICRIMKVTDWEVVVLDSYRHRGFKERLDRMVADHPDYAPRLKQFQHDLVCPISPDLIKEIGKVDYILHMAAMTDVQFSKVNPVYVIKNNVDSTLTILEYALVAKPEQFIYFSTDEVYGPVEKGQGHKEWSTHRPSNAYAASKAACEDICYAYWRSYGLPLIITNTMNNFGEMQSNAKFPVLVQNALENDKEIEIHGSEKEIGTRFYIHSGNVGMMLLYVISKGAYNHKIGEIDEPFRYHLVGEVCLSNLELAQTIAGMMGKTLKYKLKDFHADNPAHDIHYGLEDNKIRPSGWKQPVSFEDSLKETIRWQQENKEWIK